MELMKKELDYHGVSVVIPRRECIQTAMRSLKDAKKAKEKEKVQA
jgi:indolepyruvate ferredoxin oxidoreductase alpha subunit